MINLYQILKTGEGLAWKSQWKNIYLNYCVSNQAGSNN
jgi:hypothetical protein